MITLIDTTPIGSKSDNLNELKSSGVEVKDNLTKNETPSGNMYTYKFDGQSTNIQRYERESRYYWMKKLYYWEDY